VDFGTYWEGVELSSPHRRTLASGRLVASMLMPAILLMGLFGLRTIGSSGLDAAAARGGPTHVVTGYTGSTALVECAKPLRGLPSSLPCGDSWLESFECGGVARGTAALQSWIPCTGLSVGRRVRGSVNGYGAQPPFSSRASRAVGLTLADLSVQRT
jgi:hypothetical protein